MEEFDERLMAEFAGMEPIYAHGIARAVSVGSDVVVYLWKWGVSAHDGQVCQVPAVLLIRPRASLWDAQRLSSAPVRRSMAAAMAH